MFSGDLYLYSVTKNRDILEALVLYTHEKGLTGRKPDVNEIFAPKTY